MTYFKTYRKEDCCGCRACENVCTKDALHLEADEEGFYYPVKNDQCTDCGLCEKVCPYNPLNLKNIRKQNDVNKSYPIAIAGYAREEREGSSSGGIFYLLAKTFIEKGGIVYGAAFDEKFQLKHVAAHTIDELEPLRGSKYLQSNMGNIYKDIKKNLRDGQKVLFSGTPCQVAGLKSYLQSAYENLLTIDLICHGVPNQWLFDQHIAYLQNKYKGILKTYHFRNEEGWGGGEICDFTTPKNKKKRIYNPTYYLSPYLYSFIKTYTFRFSCYECPFAKIPRVGDITLGDFWGIEKLFPNMDVSKGVSAITINTPIGEKNWNLIKNKTESRKTEIKSISDNNSNLIAYTAKPSIRNSIYRIIRQKGYLYVTKNEFRHPNYTIIHIKEWLKLQKFITPLLCLIRRIRGIK